MKHQIYFCDSVRSLKTLVRSELSPGLLEEIRLCHSVDRKKNSLLFVFPVLYLIGAATIAYESWWSGLGYLLMGMAVIGLSVIMHEASHYLMFRSQALNRVVGLLVGAPCLISLSAYRSIHLTHHAKERSEDDPDDIEMHSMDSRFLRVVYIVFSLLGTYLYLPHVVYHGIRLARRPVRIRIVLEYVFIAAAVSFGIAVLGTSAMIHYWLVPLVIASQVTSLRGLAEHGMTTGGNPFTASRTVTSNRFFSFLLLNLNYHLEHHLFPGVRWYNLPRLHRLLLPVYNQVGASVYASYAEFYRDFLKALFSPIRPNVRLIPRNLREELCG